MSDADLQALVAHRSGLDPERRQIERLQAMADQRSDDQHFDAMAAAVAKHTVRKLLKS